MARGRAHGLGFLGVAGLTALLAASPDGAPGPITQQVFRAGVELVNLPVVVRDKTGALVRGLTQADFAVFEDGRPQPIAAFAEGSPGEAVPLHLGLLLDRSESMSADLRAAGDAVVKFVGALEEAVDATFVDFSTSMNVGRFERASYPLLFERIRDQKAGGNTSLYDAIGLYVGGSLDRRGQHVLLIYTDGGDSSSTISFPKLQEWLRFGNVMVYTIGYLDNQSGSTRLNQQMRMNQISHETGGESFFPGAKKDLEKAYADILEELQARYTIGYVPASRAPDGRFRKVEVKVTRPELKGVRVRTRSGFLVRKAPQ